VLPILQGSGIQYFPFPGRISGHPSVLEGSIEEIVQSAKAITAHEGVHGLDLLAYRSKEDVPALMKAVCAAVSKPVIMAGSIDTPERICVVKEVGAAGFTIGTAALDGRYPAIANDLPGQLEAIIRDTADLNKHLSPIHKENLAKAFSDVSGLGVPKVAGQINDIQLKLARFDDDSTWSFRKNEDRLFFVHKGRLLMKFRDRDEVLEDGEFIVVPHGVECRPVALESACDVLLIDSAVKVHPKLT
jgi:mannose-6-phosphate isomerase-like protein (cupin superfamily)